MTDEHPQEIPLTLDDQAELEIRKRMTIVEHELASVRGLAFLCAVAAMLALLAVLTISKDYTR